MCRSLITPRLMIATLVATAILPAVFAAENDPDSIEPLLEQAIADGGAPAMGAVVANSQGILELAVIGNRRLDQPGAAAPDDPFHIGSVTKPFTATVIARLVEAGSLTWDVTVADVLPNVMRTARPEFDGITLEHLLAHEAGVKPMEEDEELDEVPPLSGDIRARREQFAQWVLQQEPAAEPMAEYRYSNAHFVIAAAMAERVSGQSWESLIDEHVFVPLDMQSGGFGWPGKDGEDVPWGHRIRDGEMRPVDPNGAYQLPQYFAPAGDIHASLPDMARFFGGLLAGWHGMNEYLDRETLDRMMTRRLRGGLGWGATSAFGFDRVATYSGSADTFLMVIVLIPDADLGFAVVANAFSEEVEQSVVQALRSIVRLYVPASEAPAEQH